MTDPTGQGRGASSSRLAHELLQAGRSERASAAARQRAAAALAGAVGTSAVAAKSAGWISTWKWVGASAVIVGAGVGGSMLYSARDDARPSPRAAGSAAAQPSVSSGAALAAASPMQPASAAAPAVTPVEPSHADGGQGNEISRPSDATRASDSSRREARDNVRAQTPGSATPATEGDASSPARAADDSSGGAPTPSKWNDDRLRQELHALRQARSALANGDANGALRVLADHGGGFRLLRLEAGIVRVEALRASGQRQAAHALAQELLRTDGMGPYGERLRALVRATSAAAR